MTKKTIRALMVAPGMEPCVIELYNNEEYFQKAVSVGLDEVYTMRFLKLNESTGIFYTDDAPIGWARCNRRVGARIIMGVFYIVGIKEGSLCSLTHDDIETYKARFESPEVFDIADEVDALFNRVWSDDI